MKDKKQTKKRISYFESYQKTEDGWIGYLKEGYITDNETFTIFADTKKELRTQAEIEGVHQIPIEEWYNY